MSTHSPRRSAIALAMWISPAPRETPPPGTRPLMPMCGTPTTRSRGSPRIWRAATRAPEQLPVGAGGVGIRRAVPHAVRAVVADALIGHRVGRQPGVHRAHIGGVVSVVIEAPLGIGHRFAVRGGEVG